MFSVWQFFLSLKFRDMMIKNSRVTCIPHLQTKIKKPLDFTKPGKCFLPSPWTDTQSKNSRVIPLLQDKIQKPLDFTKSGKCFLPSPWTDTQSTTLFKPCQVFFCLLHVNIDLIQVFLYSVKLFSLFIQCHQCFDPHLLALKLPDVEYDGVPFLLITANSFIIYSTN